MKFFIVYGCGSQPLRREAMPLRHQEFCLVFFAFKCKVAMILGKKLRDYRHILSENLFFFRDHHDWEEN